MIPGVNGLSYDNRLKRLGLWTLEERRNRSDLVEVYKMLNGLSSISYERFFKLDTVKRTRGHSLKLIKQRFRTVVRQHFFSERVVDKWNSLGDDVVSAPSLNSFKNGLHKLRSTRMGLFKD